MIDEDAGELVADRLVDQHRRDRGIDAAGQPADHLAAANLRADRLDGALAVGGHRPASGTAADIQREAGQQCAALLGMNDLGMELHAIEPPVVIRHGGERRACRGRHHTEPRRQRGDMVAMAHPDGARRAGRPQPVEQPAAIGDFQRRAPEFAARAGLDAAAELLAHRLLPVADAENRNAEIEHRLRGARRVGQRHRVRPAGQDDAARRGGFDARRVGRAGQDLGIDARLAEAPRDQLRHL